MVIPVEKLITTELNLIAPIRKRVDALNNKELSLIKWKKFSK